MAVTVTLSRKNQIVVPREAREKLGLDPGQKLLVLSKEDRIVLIPQPKDYVKKMSGLHKEIWKGMNTKKYLEKERDSWKV